MPSSSVALGELAVNCCDLLAAIAFVGFYTDDFLLVCVSQNSRVQSFKPGGVRQSANSLIETCKVGFGKPFLLLLKICYQEVPLFNFPSPIF